MTLILPRQRTGPVADRAGRITPRCGETIIAHCQGRGGVEPADVTPRRPRLCDQWRSRHPGPRRGPSGATIEPWSVDLHRRRQSACVDRAPPALCRYRAPDNRRPAYLSALMDLIEAQIGMLNGTHSLGWRVTPARSDIHRPSQLTRQKRLRLLTQPPYVLCLAIFTIREVSHTFPMRF